MNVPQIKIKNAPEIKIFGETCSGKSALAYAIKDALNSYGIEVAITGCEDERVGALEKSWNDRIIALDGHLVIIETVRTPSLEFNRGN